MRYKVPVFSFAVSLYTIFFVSCSSTKFVPEGEYLLASVNVKTDIKAISSTEMEGYVKQKPNFKTFSIFKLPLAIYNLSGQDTTKWVNRTLRHAGEPPVLYDSTMVSRTTMDLKRVMTNKGYLNAEVTPIVRQHKKRTRITYNIHAGEPYRINDYKIEVNDSIIPFHVPPNLSARYLRNRDRNQDRISLNIDTILVRNTLVKKNLLFDLGMLDQERDRITSLFRRTGYYAFNKEYIGFEADTTTERNKVDLELTIYPYSQRGQSGQITESPHRQYIVKDVELYVDYNPLTDGVEQQVPTSVFETDGYIIKYGSRGEYIRPEVILNNCYIRPGGLYDENMTSLTYSALSQLRILKNININYVEVWDNDSTKLHCVITCVPDRRQGISTEVDGTYSGGFSGGFFGVGSGIGYLHRNAFKGSELFSIKVRGAYEAITPRFSSFKENYFELGGETSLTFPRFMFPFLDRDFKRRIHASTQFSANYSYQRRPGYFTRTVLSSGVKYIWQDRRQSFNKHVFDLVEIGYVSVPPNSIGDRFFENLSEAAKRYSFTNQFIMSTGYTFFRTNISTAGRRNQPIYSLRASVESAGNVLALAARIANVKPDSVGSRKIFNTNFAQYVRGVVDYSKTYQVDEKNAIAWHLGGGLAYPYGNFEQVPIQKRFFSGGANSVRGWAIRELGPGSYYYKGDKKDTFFFHSGDIRFDANVEYRSKLFWVIELGAFLDAGNIWTVKEYEGQEGGSFRINKFYKQIAVAWGLGVRLDFDFVLIRLDSGWKAYNPTDDPRVSRWPIKDPFNYSKNAAWHIAVGYPF